MEEKMLCETELNRDTKLEELDRKLNTIFEEILWLQRRLDDRRTDEKEKELKNQEEEVRRIREDIMVERVLNRTHYEEKCNNFKKGYYY